jgi:hypothetical protein
MALAEIPVERLAPSWQLTVRRLGWSAAAACAALALMIAGVNFGRGSAGIITFAAFAISDVLTLVYGIRALIQFWRVPRKPPFGLRLAIISITLLAGGGLADVGAVVALFLSRWAQLA